MFNENNLAQCAGTDAKQYIAPTVTQRLEAQKSSLESSLEKVTEALDALKANPEIEKVLNLIQKASY